MVEDYLKSEKLVEILPKFNKVQLLIYVYYCYQTYPNPKVRAFLDFFLKLA